LCPIFDLPSPAPPAALDVGKLILDGGLRVNSLELEWNDVSRFFVHRERVPGATRPRIGYELKTTISSRSLAKSDPSSPDGIIGDYWRDSIGEMVEHLEQYRQRTGAF
jgi:hypothetical protein